MKRTAFTIAAIILLLLSACANRQQVATDAAQQCPQARIDVLAPDFSQSYSQSDVRAFYACMMAVVEPSGLPTIGRPGSPADLLFNSGDKVKAPLYNDMAYQQVLWQQVLAKEKTPAAAQEAWLLWSVAAANQRAVMNAADSAANAARKAARADDHRLG